MGEGPLTRDQLREIILGSDDCPTEVVEVPEWGISVTVKGMSGEQRDAFEASIRKRGPHGEDELDPRDFRAKFVSRVLVDETGARLFTNEEVKALSRKSAVALQRIFAAGQRLSGYGDEELADIQGN